MTCRCQSEICLQLTLSSSDDVQAEQKLSEDIAALRSELESSLQSQRVNIDELEGNHGVPCCIIRLFIHACMHSLTHSFIHSFIHSFVRSFFLSLFLSTCFLPPGSGMHSIECVL